MDGVNSQTFRMTFSQYKAGNSWKIYVCGYSENSGRTIHDVCNTVGLSYRPTHFGGRTPHEEGCLWFLEAISGIQKYDDRHPPPLLNWSNHLWLLPLRQDENQVEGEKIWHRGGRFRPNRRGYWQRWHTKKWLYPIMEETLGSLYTLLRELFQFPVIVLWIHFVNLWLAPRVYMVISSVIWTVSK